ncbi:kinase-interacting family protein-like [Macadamia integrifolia]|uniref:kinase-interacting family protein-like n=1 Tax=Macadamia integrifolia TaxID=60698 RepID=UPI001C4E4124|nr:kinase-interacting family protein-like [Macadamia integrifolia]XP_042506936.1 kinase-interacting family protein-like [Macadamia integrifolia]
MKTQGSSLQSCRGHAGRPPWLLATLADLEEKMKALSTNHPEEDNAHTFAERAECYYQTRPQLLSLLQDLYNGYLSLADRYCQTITKSRRHNSNQSQISTVHTDSEDESSTVGYETHFDSDAESSLSYQTPPPTHKPISTAAASDQDALIAELVAKTIDYDILINEASNLERFNTESSRKIELQKSLLEVLESERLILLNENARLGYRVNALAEENKGLASEAVFMKRKASELARCILKLREDHRVCLLSRKIEDLQSQIYGLEKRNKEYYEMLVRREEEEKKRNNKKEMMALEVCFEVEKIKLENEKLKEEAAVNVEKGREGGRMTWKRVSNSRVWERVKKIDSFICGSQLRGV